MIPLIKAPRAIASLLLVGERGNYAVYVEAANTLDTNNLGPEMAQLKGAIRALPDPAKIQDGHIRQRPEAALAVPLSLLIGAGRGCSCFRLSKI